jgi:arginyl-tRNA synthetase
MDTKDYVLFNPFKVRLENFIFTSLRESFPEDAIKNLSLTPPKKKEFGHFSLPVFPLAKAIKRNPVEIAQELVTKWNQEGSFFTVSNMGPYLNFKFKIGDLVENLPDSFEYIKEKISSQNKTIAIDYSSVNVAKPFSIGHLRSTVIGAALKNIAIFTGYKVAGINHLGDWGTQFGKIIVALKYWGNTNILEKENPIPELLELYIRFHEEAEKNPSLEDEARQAFKELEKGKSDYREIWQKICDLTIQNLKRNYSLLGINFEYYTGESFYNDKIEWALEKVKHVSQIDEGALVIRLDEENLPPLLLKKSDGATLYATRDLAALFYRKETFNPEYFLYVTGAEQKLHFKQLKLAIKKAGYSWWNKIIHIDFGLYRLGKEKISTRRGKIVLLEDVIQEAIRLAQEKVREKNSHLKEEEIRSISQKVGIGAIIFGDLVNDRIKNIDFSWNKILNFEGETAPYIQYTAVRMKSILRELPEEEKNISLTEIKMNTWDQLEEEIIWTLHTFLEQVWRSWRDFKPSYIANYLLDIAKITNNFYHKNPILKEKDSLKKKGRIFLIQKIIKILEEGINLLGIEIPERM